MIFRDDFELLVKAVDNYYIIFIIIIIADLVSEVSVVSFGVFCIII